MEYIVVDCAKIINEYNSISSIVNGKDSILINEVSKEEMLNKGKYFVKRYVQSSLDIIRNAKFGDYKSKVSDSMKLKLISIIDLAKNILIKLSEEIESIIYKEEYELANKFIEEHKNSSSYEIIEDFNKILQTENEKSSFTAGYISNHYFNDKSKEEYEMVRFIMNANIKLHTYNRKLLFSNRPLEFEKNVVRNLEYPLNTDFRLFVNDIYKSEIETLSDIFKELGVNSSLDSDKKIIDMGLSELQELFRSIQDNYKLAYGKELIILRGEYSKSDIINDEEFIYSLKNLQNDITISAESGINKQYVEKTKTISRFKNKELVEEYFSPLSLKNNKMTCYNYIDVYDYSPAYCDSHIVIFIKKFDKYQIFKNIQLFQNLQLLNPDLIKIDNEYTTSLDDRYKNELGEMIPGLYTNKASSNADLGIFIPVKMGNIRHRMIEYLKKYVRVQDKTKNTDTLIQILFNSIYEEIWEKTPKISNFSDEFYITFYASVSRMVFKMRKDIMDRYNIMKDFDSSKDEMVSLLEKVEKNIMKIDNNLYTIYKITN